MGAVPLRLVRIKKHQSFFKPWCKRFYALAYAPAGKLPKRDGTEYPDSVRGTKVPSFPQSLPRFYPSDRRTCANRKEHTPYSAVSASGIFTPFLCTLCKKAQSRVPVCHILFSVNICSPHCHYTPFLRFVNTLSQKRQLWNTPV